MEQEEIIQGKYYLKKCIMVLRSAESLPALLPLSGRLLEAGIACEVMLSEELLAGEGNFIPSGEAQNPERKVQYEEQDSYVSVGKASGSDRGKEQDGVLYLTDDPQVYARLTAGASEARGPFLREPARTHQPPVLIYLHPGNRGEDFADARYALEDPEDVEPEYLERVYRRCHDLPWEILTTERCWLRETVEADVDKFWKMYRAPGITRYTERLFPTLEAERGYVREYRRRIYPFYEFGVWTVLDRSSGEVVGRAGLSVREGYNLPELGFVIGESWQGRGLATEVCRGILEYARELLGFAQVQVLVHEENAASLHLCRKLGFREKAVPSASVDGCRILASASAAAMGSRSDIAEGCLVEMEQNGQRALFVYMVRNAEDNRGNC